MQRVTPGVGAAFGPVEEALWDFFFLALFRGLTEGLPTRENTSLPVKQAGMAIPDPVKTAPENWTASYVITGHLVAALRGQAVFRTADHMSCLRGGWLAVRHRGEQRAEAALTAALEGASGSVGTSNATGGKDWGLAHGASVHSKWHRTGGPGVA